MKEGRLIVSLMEKTSGNTNITVSIVIPARNEADNIGLCLEAIHKQETPYSVEIIVIDSGSADNTIEIVKHYPSVKLIQINPDEFGHGRTRNLGAKTAKGTYIVFLNADALPMDSHWLNPLIEPLEKNKELAGVFSRHIPKQDCYLYMKRDLETSMPLKKILRSRSDTGRFFFFPPSAPPYQKKYGHNSPLKTISSSPKTRTGQKKYWPTAWKFSTNPPRQYNTRTTTHPVNSRKTNEKSPGRQNGSNTGSGR